MKTKMYCLVFSSALASCGAQLPSPPSGYKDCLTFSQFNLGQQNNPFNVGEYVVFGFAEIPNISQRSLGKALDFGEDPFPIAVVASNEQALASSLWLNIDSGSAGSATLFIWDIDNGNEGLPDRTLSVELSKEVSSIEITSPTGLPIAAMGLMGKDAGLIRWCRVAPDPLALPTAMPNPLEAIKIPGQ